MLSIPSTLTEQPSTSGVETELLDGKSRGGEPVREQRKPTKKPQTIDAPSLGLVIYAPESHRYPKTLTMDDISSGIKSKKYKFVYTAKRPEQEIWHLIEKHKVRFTEADFKTVHDDAFRKIRQGPELSPQQAQHIKKPTTWNR